MNTGEVLERFLDGTLGAVRGKHYLVGVSGGVDSMTLLDALARARESHGFELTAAHYNYRRHDNALEAERTIRKWCDRKQVPFVEVQSVNPEELETNRRGIEGELRRRRYDFFQRVIRNHSLDGLFLAHHRDDQVETVLLNIGRGTGLSGLAGMDPVSDSGGYPVFRPFLMIEKATIRQTAKSRDIPFVEDPTNESTNFTRNGLRQEIIENWSELQPGLKTSVNRLSDLARQENDFWHRYLEDNVQYWEWPTEVQIGREAFTELDRAAQDRFLHSVPVKLLGDIKGWSRRNIDCLRELFRERSGCRIDLPGPLEGLVEYDRVCVARTDQSPRKLQPFRPSGGKLDRAIEGIGTLTVTSGAPPKDCQFVSQYPLGLEPPPLVRHWEEGDELMIDGEPVSLKELFQRSRVPLRARHMWPVLEENDTVLGLPGLGISDNLKHNDEHQWIIFEPTHPGFHQLTEG